MQNILTITCVVYAIHFVYLGDTPRTMFYCTLLLMIEMGRIERKLRK